MRKQEKIEDSYGIHWNQFKDKIDENGWIDCRKIENGNLISVMDVKDIQFQKHKQRPKAIQGIAENNGWTKIESVEDLPKKTIEYHVLRNGLLTTALYRGSDRWITPNNDYPKTTEIAEITHWQEIIKPQPPIY